MLKSFQAYERLKITVHSVIELKKFLIMQDPLENYFGKELSSGASKDRRSLNDFGYNNNTTKNQ